MIHISLSLRDGTVKDGKRRYVAKFGSAEIIDVMAKSEPEAEEKLMFMLVYELRGKTIDFDPASIPPKDAKPECSTQQK